jgi:hypothetical protein
MLREVIKKLRSRQIPFPQQFLSQTDLIELFGFDEVLAKQVAELFKERDNLNGWVVMLSFMTSMIGRCNKYFFFFGNYFFFFFFS